MKLPKKFNSLCQADQRQIIADLIKKHEEDGNQLRNISRKLQKAGGAAIKVEDRPDLANLKDLNNVD